MGDRKARARVVFSTTQQRKFHMAATEKVLLEKKTAAFEPDKEVSTSNPRTSLKRPLSRLLAWRNSEFI